MNVGILSASRGWHVEELERALRARAARPVYLPIEALVGRVCRAPALSAGGTRLDDLDAVIVRIIPRGSLEQIVFRMDALHRLERLGVYVLNPTAVIERTVDKFYTSALLEEAGLPTPPTVVAERLEDAMSALRAFGDVIVKPLFGSNGRGMVRVDDEEVGYRVFRALELDRAVYYIQRAIPHGGCDVRAFLVGGRVVAAGLRRAAVGWRTNVSRGATIESLTLPAEWEALCVQAAAAVGAHCAGVDLLPADSGEVYVLEVNGIPGWRGLQSATAGLDIAGAIADFLLQETATRRER